MKINFSKKLWLVLVGSGLFLTACIVPENEDPFERLPEESLETIEGDLFPFSVSVSTRASHRLEDAGKLVGYIASDIVHLNDFEGQRVELDGVWRMEKMRQIFWAEAVRLETSEEDEEETEVRFTTKKFTFIHPIDWEYSLAPNGTAYFLDKEDPARRVFLTFAVEDYSPEEKRVEPNIVLKSLAGTKAVTTDELGRDRETITLYSNLESKKYVFTATYSFEDFDKRRALLNLLESFVEGEENVVKLIEETKKEEAEKEAAKIKQLDSRSADQQDSKKEGGTVDEPISVEGEVEEVIEAEAETTEEEAVSAPVIVDLDVEFENLIDARAFNYNSTYYKFGMSVPFGFWFQNFGPGSGVVTEVGFADQALSGRSDVDFWLRVIEKEAVGNEVSEVLEGGRLIITKKRDGASAYQLLGPPEFRDAMWSVLSTIKSF